MNDEMLYLIIVGVLALAIIVWIVDIAKHAQLKRYRKIHIGMSEVDMLAIMGGGYNMSSLKGDKRKYEWRINARSSGTSYKGYSTRSYTGVKKVDIYTKNGFVEEIRPYNV